MFSTLFEPRLISTISVAAPAWLDQVPDLAAEEIIACSNGLLHLPTLRLLPHSPDFLHPQCARFRALTADASEPHQWLGFLDQLWPDDAEAIETLQEVFRLLPDQRHPAAESCS